jgi:hypothetical protein
MVVVASVLAYVLLLIAGMRLAERLGYRFLWGLGFGVPVLNLLILCYFAFAKSPNEERLEYLERELALYRDRRLGAPPE